MQLDMAYEDAVRKAAELCSLGRPAEAERLCRGILRVRPRDYEALRVLGLCAYFQGRPQDALLALGKALEVNPGSHQAWLNRGVALQALNRLEEAIADFDRAIALKPDYADAFCNRGNVLQSLNGYRDAIISYDRAIALEPELVEAHVNRGIALDGLERQADALAAFAAAIALQADCVEAYFARARTLQTLNRNEEALADYDRALAIRPEYAEARCNRGNALEALNRHQEALADYERAIFISPRLAEAYAGRGAALEGLNRHDEALASYDAALRLKPDYVEAHANRALLLHGLGRLEEALKSADRAIAIRPTYAEAKYGKACCLLSQGLSQEAWRLYEERLRTRQYGDLPDLGIPFLGESNPAGQKIVVQWEQRFGDIVQMLRYVPLLDSVAQTWWQIQEPLRELIARSFPGLRQIDVGERPAEAEYRLPYTSLPLAMRTFAESDIPVPVPYLRARPEKRPICKNDISSPSQRWCVGVAWRGNENPPNRSVPIEQFNSLFDADQVRFVVLQSDLNDRESAMLKQRDNVALLDQPLRSFDDTAAILAGVDLVVTIDTAVAHLAGALGLPTWILLKRGADWRWMLDRDDSPWYPTARLVRQQELGVWDDVILKVRAALDRDFPR